jgi:hypothetical protein
MPANAAIYIQVAGVDLAKVFPGVKSDKRMFRPPTYFEFSIGQDVVRFNVMETERIQSHVAGLLGYVRSLDHEQKRKDDTCYALSHTQVVLGLQTSAEFEDNHAIWASLFKIADAYDGFVFVNESILLPSGAIMVGPMLGSAT